MIIRNRGFKSFGATVWVWNGSSYVNSGTSSTGKDQYLGGPQDDAAAAVEYGVKYAYQSGNWVPIGQASGPNDEYLDQGLDVKPGEPKVGVSASDIATSAGGLLSFLTKFIGGTAAPPPMYYPPPVPSTPGWVYPVVIGGGVLLLLGIGAAAMSGGRKTAMSGYGRRLRRSR